MNSKILSFSFREKFAHVPLTGRLRQSMAFSMKTLLEPVSSKLAYLRISTTAFAIIFRKEVMSGFLLLGLQLGAFSSEPPPPTPADPAWGTALPWSRFAEVSTLPGLQGISLLNDGDLATQGIWCPGAEGSGELTIKFPQPIEVSMFRFIQTGSTATKYRLSADRDGKGAYNMIIKEQTDEKPVIRQFIPIPVGKKVYGLKFTALEGKAGYRTPFPTLAEVEIYSKGKTQAPAVSVKADKELKVGAEEKLPEFKRKEIDIRLCIDTWHAGISRKKPCVNIEESKTFQAMLKRFKEADANSARLFIETACCDDEMPWKSEKLWPGHGEDQLAPLASALHKNGLKLYFFSHAWMSPFQERGKRAAMPYCRWDYPYEQSDRIVGIMEQYKVSYPCVICDNGFRDKWLQFLKEALDQGADGIYVTPDEYYFKGHNLSRANCPLCTAEFKKMYGYDSMPKGASSTVNKSGSTVAVNSGKIEDSEQYRKWKLFEYRKIADLFHYVSAELKKFKPSAQIVMSDNKVTEDLSGRLEHNMCLDIMENDPNSDLAQMYGNAILLPVGRHSAYSRRIAAAAGKDKMLASIQWLGVYDTSPEYAIQLYGYALPQIMLGAKAYENYRLNYMYDKGWWPNAIECHKMIRLLEQWGICESDTPDTTCLLLSRASEDWWRTKLEGLCGDQGDRDVAFNLLYAGDEINKAATKSAGSERARVLKMDALRGVGSKLAMESLLCEAGIPYKVAFTDRMDNLENLKRFKLLIMPFSYSLSKAAFQKIKEAVDAGMKLIIFDQLAPVDEFGNPYKEPLLKQLLGNKNVIYVKDNLAAVGNSVVKRAGYVKILDPVLKSTGYSFNAGGIPVECIVSCLPKQEGFLVYLGNWSTKKGELAKPLMSLPFEDAQYNAECYSSATKTLNDLHLAGKPGAFDGKLLKSFSVALAPSEVKLIRIVKER
jgi:hypothetical protein